MNPTFLGLLVVSVLLSTAAQLLLKVGMSKPEMLAAMGGSNVLQTGLAVAASPWVVGGLAAYVASALVWLKVLSRIDVSQAYPCVALGFVLTALGGVFLLGEPLSLGRMAGLVVILVGVGVVALN